MHSSPHHHELNESGVGKCSVPMWMDGCPAGFCDKEAYGERPPGRVFLNAANEPFREDFRYAGYVPGLACPAHGGPHSRVFRDGNQFCAVDPNFINLQESPAGFGDSPRAARQELAALTHKQTD